MSVVPTLRSCVGGVATAVFASQLAAQTPALRLVATRDTVLVFVANPPAARGGFVVYRRPAAGGAWARRTAARSSKANGFPG